MPIGLGLRLALSSVRRIFTAVAQQPVGAEDLLLTQAGDAIITQNGDFLVRTKRPAKQFITQGGDFLLTQDDRILEESI